MLVFNEGLCSLSIRSCIHIFEVVGDHGNSVRCDEFNVSSYPLHGVDLFKDSVATSSYNLNLIVSLFVNESLEEEPNVVHLRHSAVDLVNSFFEQLKPAVK